MIWKPCLNDSESILWRRTSKSFNMWYCGENLMLVKVTLLDSTIGKSLRSQDKNENLSDFMLLHVTYAFQSESTFHSCFNIKKLARIRRDIWSLSDSNGIPTHNHLVCKRTPTVLPNDWVFVYKLSGCGFEPRCCHLRSRQTCQTFCQISVFDKCLTGFP